MIPKVNLDDRTFDDIFNDALRLIPRYCPEWTNHNTSDPGITLLELFSWMTEMTIYRLNKVPEKTYLSLLELMGLSLVAPQSSRAVVQFFPVEGIKRSVQIKAGTQISATVSDSDDIIFETEKEIKVNNAKLVSCVNRYKESWNQVLKDGKFEDFLLFESNNEVEHELYLSSDTFRFLENDHFIQVSITPVQEVISEKDELVKHIYWEYWDGAKWAELKALPSVKNIREKDNVIYLCGNVPIQSKIVNGVEGFWIRGVLSDIPENPNSLATKRISLKTIFGGKGFIPEICLKNNNLQYSVVDFNSSFHMYSEAPAFNESFYICADDILKNKNIKIEIIYSFSETNANVEENKNALFVYEYWNGFEWKRIAKENNFLDGTFNFKQSGSVSFDVPNDISLVDVNNQEHYWIRVRLVTKDYAVGGSYVKDDKDNWIWKFNSKVVTPEIDKIRIKYEAPSITPKNCIAYTNFQWKDLSSDILSDSKEDIVLFDFNKNDFPSLYIGFDNKLPDGESSLYFKINESIKQANKNFFDIFNDKDLSFFNSKRGITLCWEYYNGQGWKSLSVSDSTDSFHQSGFVDFFVPADFARSENFGQDLYWIRISLIQGGFESLPCIKDIVINAVYARNEKTYENEILGSGTGAPGQSLVLSHKNILKGSQLYVDEGSMPSENELRMIENDNGKNSVIEEGNRVWVLYKEVENFYSSTPFSRHYVIDYSTGKILFGDGAKGVNPPKGKFNIKMKRYHTGGGAVGNVTKNTIQCMLQSIPFISGCTNPYAAEGGSDMESVDNLKARAAGAFKSLQRAVTAEDYQWLAREASSSVARSYCLKNRNAKNEVCTVVIPVRPKGIGYEIKLEPSRELLRRVKEYLDERKIVGTPICVQAPVYKEFNISIALVFKSDVFDENRVKTHIENSLRSYFDTLDGDGGNGWPFGKEIMIGSVLKQLEKINEILSVNDVELFDLDANVKVEKILLKEDELPFLNKIVIERRG